MAGLFNFGEAGIEKDSAIPLNFRVLLRHFAELASSGVQVSFIGIKNNSYNFVVVNYT